MGVKWGAGGKVDNIFSDKNFLTYRYRSEAQFSFLNNVRKVLASVMIKSFQMSVSTYFCTRNSFLKLNIIYFYHEKNYFIIGGIDGDDGQRQDRGDHSMGRK